MWEGELEDLVGPGPRGAGGGAESPRRGLHPSHFLSGSSSREQFSGIG